MATSDIDQTDVLKVLHLDDDPFELERVQNSLEKNALRKKFLLESVSNVEEYRSKMRNDVSPDIIILDVHIGASITGVDLASETRTKCPQTTILMCSTADDVTTIVECLQAGADDFLSKQSDKDELAFRVFNSHRLARLKHGFRSDAFGEVQNKTKALAVGSTMEQIARRIPQILVSAITSVFIRGESGTGKEVVAAMIGSSLHESKPFIKVNCGAIAPSLLESELFGHVKGAFTGAIADKRGLLEAADGGWIFLDEVATLTLPAQVALLRVLENRELLRVGATKTTAINIRVLAATNEPIDALISQGKFRQDLWQRLRETEIYLPPLRERPEEIPALIEYFCKEMHGGPYEPSRSVIDVLSSSLWKDGNIRELRNCLRAMTEMQIDQRLTPLAIPTRIWDEIGVGKIEDVSSDSELHLRSERQDIVLEWRKDPSHTYDYMGDLLLIEMTKIIAKETGKVSLRSLSLGIGLSRSTLSMRLKGAVARNVISQAELQNLFTSHEGKAS